MRIALVHPFAWPDVRRGGERYLDDLAWFLRRQGHDVDVVTGSAGPTLRRPTEHGSDLRLHHLPNLEIWRMNVKLREVDTFGARAFPTLLRQRYDIVHALMPTPSLAAGLAGQRVVLTLLGHPTEAVAHVRAAKRRALFAAVRNATTLTALSTRVAADVESVFGRSPVVLAPGLRDGRFAPAPRGAVPTIFFASAMVPEKGIDVLLKAFAIVAAQRADVRLMLSGPGDPKWAFDAAGADLAPYLDRVDNVGPGDPADLPGRYAAAHVTVLPSRNEAFGLALAESLASGTPVVGCAGGGADDIVTEEVGRIVEHGNVPALAAALVEVLELATTAGIADRCVARAQLWDWSTSIGPQHVAVYEETLTRRRWRRPDRP